MKIIILAAGAGTRLGETRPKPLTPLYDGVSILGHQIEALTKRVDIHDIFVVVGFKKEMVMEAFPDLLYVYNERYHVTNTSKSLLAGLRKVKGSDVIWLNGDVVLDDEALARIEAFPGSCMGVNVAEVDGEAVKYRLRENGALWEVSKEVEAALGEALGINKVSAAHLTAFIDNLEICNDDDYFEKALEMMCKDGVPILPVDLSNLLCLEVDDVDDLALANLLLKRKNMHA
jgi:choline kinase